MDGPRICASILHGFIASGLRALQIREWLSIKTERVYKYIFICVCVYTHTHTKYSTSLWFGEEEQEWTVLFMFVSVLWVPTKAMLCVDLCTRACEWCGGVHVHVHVCIYQEHIPASLLARTANRNSRKQTGKEKSRLLQDPQPILDLCSNNVNRQLLHGFLWNCKSLFTFITGPRIFPHIQFFLTTQQ